MADAVKTILVKATAPYALRQLANALDRKEHMSRYAGISCPMNIRYFYGETECTAFGDNPTLLAAIGDEIRKRWPELRAAAFNNAERDIVTFSRDLQPILAQLGGVECSGLAEEIAAVVASEAPTSNVEE